MILYSLSFLSPIEQESVSWPDLRFIEHLSPSTSRHHNAPTRTCYETINKLERKYFRITFNWRWVIDYHTELHTTHAEWEVLCGAGISFRWIYNWVHIASFLCCDNATIMRAVFLFVLLVWSFRWRVPSKLLVLKLYSKLSFRVTKCMNWCNSVW